MTADFGRGIFALLCVLCAIAIVTSAWLEMARMRRGDSLLAPRHFRLRLFSAFIWMVTLLSLAGAVTIWWTPPNPTDNQKLQLYAVFTGSVSLMSIGLLLLFVDMWMLSKARRKVEREQTLRFSEQLRELAEVEGARLRAQQSQQSSKNKKVRAYGPQNGTANASSAVERLDNPAPNGLLDSSE